MTPRRRSYPIMRIWWFRLEFCMSTPEITANYHTSLLINCLMAVLSRSPVKTPILSRPILHNVRLVLRRTAPTHHLWNSFLQFWRRRSVSQKQMLEWTYFNKGYRTHDHGFANHWAGPSIRVLFCKRREFTISMSMEWRTEQCPYNCYCLLVVEFV